MAYEALLFCPDEKTARTVTQVLTELEFSVDPCTEPFAAVKKLMSQHFDAVVVDCDNEQNATLLFKSARNSTSNQASLAVAIVEGQAGVAKAFRIGANLVLTKPINVEQSKGTLRVARGLLRKGEPGKPAPVAPSAATSASAPATSPKPSAPKPVAKPAGLAVTGMRQAPAPKSAPTPASRPTVPPVPKPVTAPAPQIAASTTSDAAATATAPAASPKTDAPFAAPFSAPAVAPSSPAASPKIPTTTFGSGAASAPAPAREPGVSSPAAAAPAIKPEKSVEPAPPAQAASPAPARSESAPPTFTFGGANVDEPSSGSGKKIVIGLVAAIVIAAGAYAGWTYFPKHSSPAVAKTTLPPAIAPKPQPSTQSPSPVTTQPVPAAPVSTSETKADENTTSAADDAGGDEFFPGKAEKPSHPDKTSPKPSPATSKDAPAANNAPAPAAETVAPLVVKGGSAPHVQSPQPTSDSPAPSLIGIGASASTGDLSNIVGDQKTAKPVLQTMKISQGVAQGLIVKRVAPLYPTGALTMRIEGAVELDATISKEGTIKDIKVLKGDPQLSRAAVQAVKQWKYKPYLLNGEPVEIQTQITVDFKLPQ